MLACRVLGHRYRFRAEGETMLWECERSCGAGSSKRYPTAQEAQRYAKAFDKEDRDDLGRRAPFLGMFPLRIYRSLKDRRR